VDDDPMALVAELVDRVRRIPHRVVAVELQVGDGGGYDKVAGRFPQRAELCVIVVAPGWTDSRYHPVMLAGLPANDEPERSAARTLTRSLAECLALPYDTSAVRPDQYGSLGPRWLSPWIAAQGPAPPVDIDVQWEAVFLLDDGESQTATGIETTTAHCGKDACLQVTRAVHARVGSDDGPTQVRASIPAMPENPGRGERWPGFGWSVDPPRRRLDVTVEELRGHRRSGLSPAQIIRSIGKKGPREADPTAVALMWALHEAFELPMNIEHSLEELAEIGPWWAGRLSDVDLDAALGPRLDRTEPHWNMAHRLREAHRSGRGVTATLGGEKAHGRVWLVSKLKEAFDLPGIEKPLEIVAALDSDDGGAADALLEAALGAMPDSVADP
jgi:hypothetical protein